MCAGFKFRKRIIVGELEKKKTPTKLTDFKPKLIKHYSTLISHSFLHMIKQTPSNIGKQMQFDLDQ